MPMKTCDYVIHIVYLIFFILHSAPLRRPWRGFLCLEMKKLDAISALELCPQEP